MSNHRNLDSSGGVINPSNEDRMSQLSDDILCCIFSYLPTKEAVATCVLSKRWKYVWASTQELTIESRRYRSLSYHIRRFLTCRTLVKLTIKGAFVVDIPPSTTGTTFPCLKILSLDRVVYLSHISAQKLLSICHVLEDLTISRQDSDGLQVLIISVPSLKSLKITSHIPGDDHILKVEIDCPRVQYFEFHGESHIQFISNLSSVVEAQIHSKCGLDFLKGISNVKFLTLSDYAVWGLDLFDVKNSLPTFDKLVKLELFGNYFFWEFLPALLEKSPNLKVLDFPEGFAVPKSPWHGVPGFHWQEPNSVPQCLISRLKKIRLNDFSGMTDEIDFLEYMFKFGKVLKTVEVGCASAGEKWAMMMLDEGLKVLQMCPRASRSCVLIVQWLD